MRETIPSVYLNGILNDTTIGLETVNDLKFYDKEIKQKQEALKSLDVAVEPKEERLQAIIKTLDLAMYPEYVERKQKLISRKEVVELPKEKWDANFIYFQDYQNMEKQIINVSKRIKVYETTDFYKSFKYLQQENMDLRKELQQKKNKNERLEQENKDYEKIFSVLTDIQESLRDIVKDNFDMLMNFTEHFNKVTPRLTSFAKGIILATVIDKNTLKKISIGKECWNESFEVISKEIFLPGNELELQKRNTRSKSIGLSR